MFLKAILALFLALQLVGLAPYAQALSRETLTIQSGSEAVTVDRIAADGNKHRPAVAILSGSRGFKSSAYDEVGRQLNTRGFDAYLVHVLSFADLAAIAAAPDARTRVAYYAKRLPHWTSSVAAVISYLNESCGQGKVGLLGVSLGAEIAIAAAANATNVGALALVDGGFPEGYSRPIDSLPPLLLVWGEADSTFPLSVARQLRRTAERLGGPVTLEVFKEGAHDFFLRPGPEAEAAHRSVAAFFETRLSP